MSEVRIHLDQAFSQIAEMDEKHKKLGREYHALFESFYNDQKNSERVLELTTKLAERDAETQRLKELSTKLDVEVQNRGLTILERDAEIARLREQIETDRLEAMACAEGA